ncbi:unnamed protein product [Spirodela intermedia]|uniref:Uncharacterized protein n=2 Tax=Spirodela intermedia TaxID=51605 RepID=A0A7I8L095_SPIIN|nr:unnamed protein product [Spirodela intermedia]CAA6665970.1 unnamed protein product [Spirodela intermedia]CAA7402728.1 unnamed protein product [Spirodela intermedia]
MKYNPTHMLVHRTNSGKRCSNNFKMIMKEEPMVRQETIHQVANRLTKHAAVSSKACIHPVEVTSGRQTEWPAAKLPPCLPSFLDRHPRRYSDVLDSLRALSFFSEVLKQLRGNHPCPQCSTR